MLELGPVCLDGSVAEIAKSKMACIGGVAEPIVWYSSPLWMMIVTKVG
jgi:hypothetical protein